MRWSHLFIARADNMGFTALWKDQVPTQALYCTACCIALSCEVYERQFAAETNMRYVRDLRVGITLLNDFHLLIANCKFFSTCTGCASTFQLHPVTRKRTIALYRYDKWQVSLCVAADWYMGLNFVVYPDISIYVHICPCAVVDNHVHTHGHAHVHTHIHT